MMKANMPNFLKITHIGKGKEEGDWVKVKVRINPYNIHCYMEAFITKYEGKDVKKMIAIFVSNDVFYVDMTIEEADKMMEDIDRTITFNDEEL